MMTKLLFILFNLFKSKKTGDVLHKEVEFTDHSVKYFYTNIINSLILFTYDSEQLDKMESILIDPFTELYEELYEAFRPAYFEAVFRNKLLDPAYKNDLLEFKNKVEAIPSEMWEWEFLDKTEIWKEIRNDAEVLLNKIGITSRIYNDEFTTIILNTGKIVKSATKL